MTMLAMAAPFILAALILFIFILLKRRKKRGREYIPAQNWTMLDASGCIALFMVLNVFTYALLYVPLPFILPSLKMISLQVLAGILTVLIFTAAAVKRKWNLKEKFSLQRISVKKAAAWIFLSYAALITFNICYENLIDAMNLKRPDQFIKNILPDASQPLNLLVCFFAICIMIPLIEELIFRVIVYNGLRSKLPVWGAVIISSLIFSAMHMESSVFVPIFFMGMVFAYTYEKTSSIIPSFAIHSLNNTVSLAIFVFFSPMQ
jgi:membrane protease YdiL (CAAX protease family)